MCEGEISPDARETEIGGLPARYSCDQSNFTKHWALNDALNEKRIW